MNLSGGDGISLIDPSTRKTYIFAGSSAEGRLLFENPDGSGYVPRPGNALDPPSWRAVERKLVSSTGDR